MLFISPVIAVFVLVVTALVGLVMGSFINCWAWRAMHGESILTGRSHCTNCEHELEARDLIPIVSWLTSGGTCRYCGEKVSVRYPLTEAICAIMFVLIVAVYGLSLETLELLIFAGILLFLSLTDLDERIIPNACIVAAIAVRLVYLVIACILGIAKVDVFAYYLASAFGVGIVLLILVVVADKIFGRESMGGGDLKLFFVAGLYFGWQQCVLLVIMACVIGILVAVVTSRPSLDSEKKGIMGRSMPFGPSIAAACIITMLVGTPILTWYLGFFTF